MLVNHMVYFVRHGQSEANLKGVFAGQKENSLLTDAGKEQAQETALSIKSEIPDVERIISSPLLRALETAQIIAKEIGFSGEIEIDDRIIEYDMGSLTGTEFHKISSKTLVQAENAEDPDKFYMRVIEAVKQFSNSSENILVVSHAGVGRILEIAKLRMAPELFYDLPAYVNASVTKIDWIK